MNISRHLEIRRGPRLADRTSMRLGGFALAEVLVRDVAGLDELPGVLDKLGGRAVVIGAGTNIIAADHDLPLALVRLHGRSQPERLREEDGAIFVRVCGEYPLPALLGRLAGFGASGLEGLAGIPGSVGGAAAMNAGSFCAVFGNALENLTVYVRGSGLMDLGRDALELGYRRMAIKGHDAERDGAFLVTDVTLRLHREDPEAIWAAMKECTARKKSSQPVNARSAGCVYKNPMPDMPAGRLLEEAGMKGKRKGGMAFSELHANFLVNEGHGSFAAAMDLMEEAEMRVKARFGVTLEREVLIWA